MVKVHEILRAVREGNAQALELLLRQDRTEVDKFNESQRTPLMVACEEGNPHVVQILLTYGADVNRSAFGNPSALMLAIEHRHAEVVRLLMQYNPDATYGTSAVGGGTVLSHALHKGFHDMADLLLQLGVDINARDKMGITALMYAAIDGSFAEVEYLLNNGANMNLSCNTLMMMGQKTALLAAAMHDNAQVVRLLVDRGAELLPPHYREFLQRSHVEESEEARTCSALLRQAEANSDCRRRENAVDLTGADEDVSDAAPPDSAQAGRGRGIMHAIPAWMQAQNGGLIPRHVETMREFQMFRQGELPPPKRGPLYHPNTYAISSFTGTGSSSSQFSDAEETRRHKPREKSSIHQPFEVDDFDDTDRNEPPAKRPREDSRSRDSDRDSSFAYRETNNRKRSRCRSRDRSGRRSADKDNDWTRDNRQGCYERERSNSPHRTPLRCNGHNGAYDQDYHRVLYQYEPHSAASVYSPPRGTSPVHHMIDNGRYMINNALSNYTPKPPRPRQPPKPLQPEPVILPDVDFVRSKGKPLPPGREINSYAECDRKRREAEASNRDTARDSWPEQDNNNSPVAQTFQNTIFRPASYHERECVVSRTPNMDPPTHTGEASALRHSPPRGDNTTAASDAPQTPLFTPPLLSGDGAGRGRKATLPAWVTADSTPTTCNADNTDRNGYNGRKRGRGVDDAAAPQGTAQPVTDRVNDETMANKRVGDVRGIVPPVIPMVTPVHPAPSPTGSQSTPASVKCFSMSDLLRAKSPVAPTIPEVTWLHGYLSANGMNSRWIATCERVLVQEQRLCTRDMFATLPVSYLDDAHLEQLGLTSIAAQMALRRLHARLNAGEPSRTSEFSGYKEEDDGTVASNKKEATFGIDTDVDDSEAANWVMQKQPW